MPIEESETARVGAAETHTHYHLHLERERGSGEADKGRPKDKAGNDDGDQGKDGKDGEGGDGADKKQPRNKKPLIILLAVVIVGAVIALIVWFAKRNQVTTDDAYTDGNAIVMSPKVSGYVTELHIDDNTFVRKGQLLLRIETADYAASQSQARAQLASARAQLQAARVSYDIARVQFPAQLESARAQQRSAEAGYRQARLSHQRQHSVDPRATTRETIDAADSQEVAGASNVANARAQLAVAELAPDQIRQAAAQVHEREAGVAQAEAQLQQADLNVGYTEIRAPSDGFVTKRNVQLGSYLAAGVTMFLIVSPDVWITANFKESQLGRMRPGDPVDIEIDAYSGMKLAGHVQSIQQGSGSRFSAFPTENATGNFVKVVQRVPVKIVIDRGLDPRAPLPLGLSVSPVVHFP